MRLSTIRSARGFRAALWCAEGDDSFWIDLKEASRALETTALSNNLRETLKIDGPGLPTVRQIWNELRGETVPDSVSTWPGTGSHLGPPIPDPGTLIDFYAFEEHVRRARARRGLDIVPEWFEYPVYYRSNQRAVIGHGDPAVFPPGAERMDFELELAAVLGAAVESPTPAEAEAAIVGYCLFNDWSWRSIQAEVMKVGLGPAKGKDFASSIGPWIVTPDELGPLEEVELTARVNGKTWSQGSPGAMAWTWGEMLAFAGEGVRFEPGDIFGSGTVGGGCGLELGRFLEDGDVVELDGGPKLGVLTGTVQLSDGVRNGWRLKK